MARGEKLGKALLLFDVPEVEVPEVVSRGRSSYLIEARNERLMHRFVFYRLANPMWGHDYLVSVLAEQFDLSTTTVGELLTDNDGAIREIRANWEERRKELKKRWWWMVW